MLTRSPRGTQITQRGDHKNKGVGRRPRSSTSRARIPLPRFPQRGSASIFGHGGATVEGGRHLGPGRRSSARHTRPSWLAHWIRIQGPHTVIEWRLGGQQGRQTARNRSKVNEMNLKMNKRKDTHRWGTRRDALRAINWKGTVHTVIDWRLVGQEWKRTAHSLTKMNRRWTKAKTLIGGKLDGTRFAPSTERGGKLGWSDYREGEAEFNKTHWAILEIGTSRAYLASTGERESEELNGVRRLIRRQ